MVQNQRDGSFPEVYRPCFLVIVLSSFFFVFLCLISCCSDGVNVAFLSLCSFYCLWIGLCTLHNFPSFFVSSLASCAEITICIVPYIRIFILQSYIILFELFYILYNTILYYYLGFGNPKPQTPPGRL